MSPRSPRLVLAPGGDFDAAGHGLERMIAAVKDPELLALRLAFVIGVREAPVHGLHAFERGFEQSWARGVAGPDIMVQSGSVRFRGPGRPSPLSRAAIRPRVIILACTRLIRRRLFRRSAISRISPNQRSRI